ncbi:MAG TPA: ring-cleaving dioxygenase [Bryobacteraceae bacterium]
MTKPILGIHHVTAIATDPQRNLDFYTEVLGLRLVKRTVNFDDPGTYHFYFGDETGSPGTILTFFPWPNAGQGRAGVGQTTVTSFSVPEPSLSYWEGRLRSAGVPVEASGKRFDEDVLTFADPDGLKLEIVAHADARQVQTWTGTDVPLEHSIRGFHSVTLAERNLEATAGTLQTMGFHKVAEAGNRFRFEVGEGGDGTRVDVLALPTGRHGSVAAGTVHHVAFRVADDESQLEWRKDLIQHGLDVTPVQDRNYFHSIYFREPGGVLFELATDPPGFAIDEPVESLGEALKLPESFKHFRDEIEKVLPPIELHKTTRSVK